ncbi:MAG: type II toxin-antitoxin system VapC family toxin [bacterium]
MITFVDTNVLLDVFLPDPEFGGKSLEAIEKAYNEGSLIINNIIYAELAPQFDNKEFLDNTLVKLGIRIIPIDQKVAYTAGMTWKQYRNSGGSRKRILTDFLIGAHAQIHSERLLSRDRGFYKKYFGNLNVIY